jgi:sugar-specific transcriptional regulator TrmB
MLAAIGLDKTHEAAYRVLVSMGAADVPDLARRLAAGEYDTERALRALEQHGLAAQSTARPDRWVAAPPGVALGALLTQRRHELEQAELTVALLAREYRAGAAEPAVHDLVEVVVGAAAVAQRFLQLQLGAGEEVCALVTGEPMAVSCAENVAEEKAVGFGVRYRVVVERANLDVPSGMTELKTALRRGELVRVLDKVPTKLVIADRNLAMVPLTAHSAEPAALVVHASGLLELLAGLFESVWREALPLRLERNTSPDTSPDTSTQTDADADGDTDTVTEEQPPGPDPTDLEILSLLLAGLTDASAAKQLDLGLRTVQRRVKRLMELTGVTTRLQLGWHAYERGWVARDR